MRKNLLQTLRLSSRSSSSLSLDDWISFFSFNSTTSPFSPSQTNPGNPTTEVGGDFRGLIEGAYKANGVVFACMLCRQLLFAEARFQFRELNKGRPGDLYGTPELKILETPWPNGTTGDLLTRMIQDADLAGNFFALRRNNRIYRLRPDWVTIVSGSKTEQTEGPFTDLELLGYWYKPGGPSSGEPPVVLFPEETVHFAPIPDPSGFFRGMSWLVPVIREIMGDQSTSEHKLRFFDSGATPNLIISLDPTVDQEAFEAWMTAFREDHEGAANAYKTLFLGGGANAQVVGSNMRQISFKEVQGAGETRIAAAAGVPPVIVGLSEGLQAATYSNYSQARRRFSDGTMRPLWRNAAASLASVIREPRNSQLWYDTRDIAFLREDESDISQIQVDQAAAIKSLTEAGFEPDSAIKAIVSGDLSQLKHTGLTSVQLLPPGQSASSNGSSASEKEEPMTKQTKE